MTNLDIEFCNKIFELLDGKIVKKLKKAHSNTMPMKNIIQYCFEHGYLRVYFCKDGGLDVTITVERYGPNEQDFNIVFSKDEMCDKTALLLSALILVLSYAQCCPEDYFGSSAFLAEYSHQERKKKNKVIPLSWEDYENYPGYTTFYERLLFEIEHAKENADAWIDFVNSECFRLFQILAEHDYDNKTHEWYCEVIRNSSLSKTLKNNLISSKWIKNEYD